MMTALFVFSKLKVIEKVWNVEYTILKALCLLLPASSNF